MMKLVIISVLLGVAYSAVTKCFTTSGDKVESAACTKSEEKCSGPSFDVITGISKMAYGCGKCSDDDKADTSKKCVDCDADDCNKLLEAGTDFECEKYEFKENKFTAAAAKTKCKGLKGKDNVCNKPGAEAKAGADYTVMKDGCGECDKTQLDAKKCAQVAGAAGLTAFLVPLLAALYTLF